MTVLAVVLTLMFLILIDYAMSRKRVTVVGGKAAAIGSPNSRGRSEYWHDYRLPENVRYHLGHTWALRESPTLVRVGIDGLAAHMIGRAQAIGLPRRGQWIRQGQKIVSILVDGRKFELVSPIEGEVTGINEAVVENPELLSKDPFGKGWLLTVISPDAETNFRNLLGGDTARQWMAEEESRLSSRIPVPAATAAQDDGSKDHPLPLPVSAQGWTELTREFFLM
ncbi:MAG TPA: glycine cleavage system protein H [Terriglobia bacterium]|nr:glycine cleavage system protein H [Terriglobia bacterium]